MKVTFRQVRVFAEVVAQGSMIRATQNLHLTAPAVSMQIKEAEKQVGLPLFGRKGGQVSLSTVGEYFLVHAERLLAQLKEAETAMARLKRLERGVLTIGIVGTADPSCPSCSRSFTKSTPASTCDCGWCTTVTSWST